MRRFCFCSQLSANHKKAVLDADETIPVNWLCNVCQQQADLGIQFVDGAVALKAGTCLIDALPADKRSSAGITGLGINFHD